MATLDRTEAYAAGRIPAWIGPDGRELVELADLLDVELPDVDMSIGDGERVAAILRAGGEILVGERTDRRGRSAEVVFVRMPLDWRAEPTV